MGGPGIEPGRRTLSCTSAIDDILHYLVQLPRKTGRPMLSHPQAFPFALSVHSRHWHWYFKGNRGKVFMTAISRTRVVHLRPALQATLIAVILGVAI